MKQIMITAAVIIGGILAGVIFALGYIIAVGIYEP